MCLVALQDSGLTVFPTHRLAVDARRQADALRGPPLERDWTETPRDTLSIGYYAGGERRTLYLKDCAIADAALAGQARALPPARHRRARGADPRAARSG